MLVCQKSASNKYKNGVTYNLVLNSLKQIYAKHYCLVRDTIIKLGLRLFFEVDQPLIKFISLSQKKYEMQNSFKKKKLIFVILSNL